MKNKNVRIMIVSSNENFWYHNMIGQRFNIVKTNEKDYVVKFKNSTGRVLKKDCVLV